MIAVSNLALNYGKKILFEGVSLKFKEGCRYGIIGANGTGKSTFLKILMGIESPSAGNISLNQGLKVGYLKQDHYEYEEDTVLDTVLKGNPELYAVYKERDELYSKSQMTDADGERAAELEEKFEELGGYQAESIAGQLLEGLAIPTSFHTVVMRSLTGGFKLRVLLAQVLFQKPDVLLLDEPTNHLDIRTIHWLENFLKNYEGCVLVISHDRHFINSVSTHVCDLDYQTIKVYPGNYDDFMEAATMAREQLVAENRRKKEQIAELQEFVNRFSANASKSKQATSRAKLIDKIEITDIRPSSRVSPYIRFKIRKPLGKKVIEAVDISKSYARPLFSNLSLSIGPGEKVALIGANGVGKTTLLNILMRNTQPDSGHVEWGESVSASLMPQDHHAGMEPHAETLVDWLYKRAPAGTEMQTIRATLGRMLFSGDTPLKPTNVLSGGETVRVLLARMLLSEDNVLALDEPTNHLDLESIEALNYALSVYEGTVLFASHDREFISSLATRIIEITPSGVKDFTGSFDDYLKREGADFFKRLQGGDILAPALNA